MAKGYLLETSTVDLTDVFANGKLYRVPPYQRDYSWTIENWEDLWQDIVGLQSSSLQHYMGAIVLQEAPEGLTIIDGQQRLATLSILALAVLNKINGLIENGHEAEENRERFDLLFKQFIGTKDPASLRYSSKLSLNERDDDFYQRYLIEFRAPINARKLADSQRALWEAYCYFANKVTELFAQANGSTLAEFLNNVVAKRLTFIEIRVEDDLSAYTVFETLNARGLELTEADLLKNYLFSRVAQSETDLDQARKQWDSISRLIAASELPGFLRHFLNSRRPYVRRERVFKTIKETVSTRDQVFPFLDSLERTAYLYCALDDPHDEYWLDFSGCKEIVRVLRLFRVTQYKPVALATEAVLGGSALREILSACLVISFRFNVIGRRNTHELEQVYNRAAVDMSEGRASSVREVIDGLRPVYVPDEEFRNDFALASISTGAKRRLVAYILCELERHRSGADLDFETASATVEHVLPENAAAGWEHFKEEDRERFTYRLGNLTLLERGRNRDAGAKPFDEKRQIYASSQYSISREIDADEWTPDSIAARQREMARWATSVWRLD